MTNPGDDRIFTPYGRRHYRRTYSTLEVRLGLAILAALAGVGWWVYERGQHPDPGLFAADVGLEPAAASVPDRGPLPDALAIESYREARVTRFGPDNLFEKINGRADFFKSRGFEALHFTTLQHEDPNRSVDVELYDMGNAQNALGAYGAERSPEVSPERVAGAQFHREPNALFMARGRFYIRVTAASAEAPVPAQLERVRERLQTALEGAQRPWSEALFVERLGLPADALGFVTENAFSFGFAKNVHTAAVPDTETELFVVPAPSESAARELAEQFVAGFGSYGVQSKQAGLTLVTDRYLKRVSTAAADGGFALGVVAAEDRASAVRQLAALRAALRALPEDERARALAAVTSSAAAPEPKPAPATSRDPERAHAADRLEAASPVADAPEAPPAGEPTYD